MYSIQSKGKILKKDLFHSTLGGQILTDEKKKKLLLYLKSFFEPLNILNESYSNEVYIKENEFSKVTSILNFLGSIGAYFKYPPITDEHDNLIEFDIIIHDYSKL